MEGLHDILEESGCEIHSVSETPGGNKSYKKASKKEFVETANHVKDMSDVAELLKDKTTEERFKWIEETKAEGNEFYRNKEYGQALDKYLNALYGLDFKDQSIEIEKKINFELKVPILNNMSICLLKVKEYRKVVAMTDQVLLIDPENFKALIRRVNALIELGKLVEAKDVLDKAKASAKSKEDNKEVTDLTALYEEKSNQEKEFAK